MVLHIARASQGRLPSVDVGALIQGWESGGRGEGRKGAGVEATAAAALEAAAGAGSATEG